MGVRKNAKAFLQTNHPRAYADVVRVKEALVAFAWKLSLIGRSPRNVFRTMYAWKIWGGNESRSGGGSGLGQTKKIKKNSPLLINALDGNKLLDAPCGDCHWMR